MLNDSVKPIYVVGHSRGGVFAYFMADVLNSYESTSVSCITFGAPKPGTKRFRDEYNSESINTTRVVTRFDKVPSLPPHILGFRHVGNEHKLHQPWYMRFFYNSNHISQYGKLLFKEKV